MKSAYPTILIIPCFNEEKRLDINSYQAFLSSHSDFFFVFVNDGSQDNTKSILDSFGQLSSNVSCISLSKNSGKAEAVREGILYSLANYSFDQIGFIDADLSTPLEEFISFKEKLVENPKVNIILGSRVQMLGKDIKRNLLRHWFSRIIATAICKVLYEPVYDTQCGAKLFSRKTAEELFKEKFLTKWLFDVELLSRYKRKHGSEAFKKTILEIPVKSWTEKPNSKLRYSYILKIFYDLLKIRNHYFKK